MIRQVKLRPRAEAGLDDIWDYTVETWSEAQAVDDLSGMDAALMLTAEFLRWHGYGRNLRHRYGFIPTESIWSFTLRMKVSSMS